MSATVPVLCPILCASLVGIQTDTLADSLVEVAQFWDNILGRFPLEATASLDILMRYFYQ